MIRLHGVGKQFANGTLALSKLDLAIQTHSFVSLLGPSGCGKSTVLRLMAGLIEPSAGHVEWDFDSAERREDPRVSFVFQEPTLMPWATVFDNVWLPLRLAGVTHAQAGKQVMQALTSVDLAGFADVYPRELSGGMKMRTSIARAMITQPELLLMDEPFAALDEQNRFRLNRDTLDLWQASRCTTVFVTHSVFESVFLSERIVVMAARPGRVVADIRITEPYPRTEDFRLSGRYVDWCAQVSKALQQAADHAGP